jgi:adenosylmethionine-8-amino-7-oxononanoate aminotransferase
MPSRNSESWRARDRAVLWHPFTQQRLWAEEDFPVVAAGKGVWLEDVEGKRYLDGVSSLWCNIHGHAVPEIGRAMKRQLDRISHATFLGLTNPPAVELAERLVAIAPKGLTRVFYSDNGSTAVEVACKMAFQYWSQNGKPQKRKFVAFDAGYHGDTVGTMALGGIDLYHATFRPLFFPTIKAPTTYAYRCDQGADSLEACGKHCLEEVEAILRTHGREVAGLVVEPLVQGAGGMIVQPAGFLKALRGLCTRYDVLLIADEVMTGFGRTGTMFACEQEGVTPDLLCLSKGITSGYLPLAATLATEKIYEGFLGDFKDRRTFYHGHTYTGNALACAAALASLELFKKRRTLEKAKKLIHRFGNLLQEFYRLPNVGDVRVRGLIAGIELVADAKTKQPFPWEERTGHKVILEARKRGVILRPLGDTIVLMPPLAVTERELEKLVSVALESVKAVTA